MSKRRICVVTGTRADYGLLRWLMHELQNDDAFELQIVATGMHLAKEFGLTYRAIEEDGFTITAKVDIGASGETPLSVARSMGTGITEIATTLDKLRPDLVVVLGDRYEILAAAQAAMVLRLPLAHIHGGELTEGVLDEAIRHAITKMSHLHFVTAEDYRQRVIQLGEQPDRVFTVGAPGLDNIARLQLLDSAALEQSLSFKLGSRYLLVTYHPETLDPRGPLPAMNALFGALDDFPDFKIVFTKANSDEGGQLINKMIDEYAASRGERVAAFMSLGQLRYLSAIKHCDAVVGNSSSGIVEAPSFKKPTVNIGDRQRGRIRAASILDCVGGKNEISATIRKALSPEFQSRAQATVSPYGNGDSASKIKKVLKSAKLEGILVKKFYDLPGLLLQARSISRIDQG